MWKVILGYYRFSILSVLHVLNLFSFSHFRGVAGLNLYDQTHSVMFDIDSIPGGYDSLRPAEYTQLLLTANQQ